MPSLAEKRVTICYTTEELQEIESAILLLKSKFKTPPAMSDDEFNALPKMGDVKRKSFGEKLKVIKKYPKTVSDPTAIDYADMSLAFFDQTTTISGWLKDCDDRNWRSGDVAGFQAMNQIAYSESEVAFKANGRNADAIEANNELERLKPTKPAKTDKPATATSGDAKK
jgi:hypothetical protein